MAGKGQTPWQKDPAILERMARVEDLHLMGATNYAIAAALTKAGTPCSEGTVRADLKRLQTVWHERLGDRVEEHRDRAVMHYRRIQRAAWQEFGAVKDTSLNKSAYLNTIKGAEDSIARVLGIEAAQKLALTDPSGEREYAGLSDAALERQLAAALATLGAGPAAGATLPLAAAGERPAGADRPAG